MIGALGEDIRQNLVSLAFLRWNRHLSPRPSSIIKGYWCRGRDWCQFNDSSWSWQSCCFLCRDRWRWKYCLKFFPPGFISCWFLPVHAYHVWQSSSSHRVAIAWPQHQQWYELKQDLHGGLESWTWSLISCLCDALYSQPGAPTGDLKEITVGYR